MSDKPLYKRQHPLILYEVEERSSAQERWVIVGPGLEWRYKDNRRKDADTLCAVLNHAALMGWQQCQTLMLTTSACVN
jgi:hypothetical protein